MPDERQPVQRIVRGAVQTLGSAYIARAINFAVQICLLFFLVPEDFGSIETAFALLALIVSLRDLGLHYALLHEHDRVEALAPTHFALSVGLGGISTLLAVLMAFFYDEAAAAVQAFETYLGKESNPAAEKVAIALAIFGVFDLIKTAALTAETQLRRRLEFGRLAFAHASATITAALAGLILAYLGFGRWALILGFFPYSVGYVAVFCAVVWMRCPPPLRRLGEFDRAAARRMVRYGYWFWVGGIPKAFALHYDKLLVSFLLGSDALGLYSAGHRFAQMPTGAVTLAIVSVTGAVYARYQTNRDRLSAAFRRTLRLILRATVPISLILALEARLWIDLFKPEWMEAAPILQTLILYSLCRPVLDDLHALFYGVGAPRCIAGFAAVQALLLLILAPVLTLEMGVYGAALSMNATALIGLILALRIARRFVDFPVLKTFGPPLLAAGAGTALRLWAAGPLALLPALPRFFAGSLIFSLGYGLALLILERHTLIAELRTVAGALTPRPPLPQAGEGEGEENA